MLSIKEEYDKCWHCENFYGPCFGEPLCMTCHLFLYPNTITASEDDSSAATMTSSASASHATANTTTTTTNCAKIGGSSAADSRSSTILPADSRGVSASGMGESAAAAAASGGNQVQSMIQKLELNDSGNEDLDSDQLNFDLTTTTNTANEPSDNNNTTSTAATAAANSVDAAAVDVSSSSSSSVVTQNEDDNNDSNNNTREREQRRSTSTSTTTTTTSSSPRKRRSSNGSAASAAAAAASYYSLQYSRKQLDSLNRNNNNNPPPRLLNRGGDQNNGALGGNGAHRRSSAHSSSSSSSNNNNYSHNVLNSRLTRRADDPLGDQIALLSSFDSSASCCSGAATSTDLINILPNEVLWNIFKKLDDLSLWSTSRVCKRWHELVRQEVSEEQWRAYITARWIFFRPAVRVKSYRTLYSQLVQSSNCFYCLQHIHNRPNSHCSDELKKSWRHKRLLLELKALHQDPMSGINARPLDASCYFWQASITGPVGSPYEGGVFYLFLKIPQSYPLNPPLVQFITRIYHPNISKHGDIGLDSIHENWSLALTISKVLISIQSLLTDPYTNVCMETHIGRLYTTNRDVYERHARYYTWKYAMSDYVQFDDSCDELPPPLGRHLAAADDDDYMDECDDRPPAEPITTLDYGKCCCGGGEAASDVGGAVVDDNPSTKSTAVPPLNNN